MSNTEVSGNVSSEAGVSVYYDNVHWEDSYQYRDKHEINNVYDNNQIYVYINPKRVLEVDNRTSVDQTALYSYTRRIGHGMSLVVKAKSEFYEVEAGFTFNYEEETTITASAVASPNKKVIVTVYDICTRETKLSDLKTEQVMKWFTWKFYFNWGTTYEYIYNYEGTYVDYYSRNL